MPCFRTASNTTPRRRHASGSVFCGSWRRTASRWWPLTCHSRPSAMWRSTATSFVGYQASGSTDRFRYAAVAAVIEHLDMKNAVHIGHSTGGGEAAHYVAQHGQQQGRVAKLVPVGGVPSITVKTPA